MTRTRILTALLLLAAATLALLPGRGVADEVIKENGGVVKGEIIAEDEFEVQVRTPYGITVRIPRHDIREIRRSQESLSEFERRWQACDPRDADQFADLGLWAQGQNLRDEAERAFRRAIELDPDQSTARRALGYVEHAGHWYTDDEYHEQVLGQKRWEDRWVKRDEYEMLVQGFRRNDAGAWMRKEDLDRQEQERQLLEEARRENPQGDVSREDLVARKTGGVDPEELRRRIAEEEAMYDDSTGGVAWDQRHRFETAHYAIESNVKVEYLPIYGRMMERYFARFSQVFSYKPGPTFRKCRILIYASQQEFMQSTGMGEGVGGFYSTMDKSVTCYHGSFGMTGNTRVVLAHEGTHQFEDLVIPMHNAPTWIIEGLAVFFESAFDTGTEIRIGTIPKDRLRYMKQAMATGQFIPLPELIRTPQHLFGAEHYAHAWSLIYTILYFSPDDATRRRNAQIFSDLFSLARRRPVTPDDAERIFGGHDALVQFQADWRAFIMDLDEDFDPYAK